ncbi:bifunctional heptose 7-phosphate kinase/heptose 1-phosphate adenyltransferase [Acidobacteriota bacterium]
MNNKNKLYQIIEDFSQKRIVVWGDFILDEYLYGTTRRISREAPVLILSYKDKEFSLGGGGNSLLNLKSLGAEPVPLGVVGQDEAGKKIIRILKKEKISTDCIIMDKDYPTPVKTRILAGEETARKQQILRIDRESKVPDKKNLKQLLEKSLRTSQKGSDALLISDYDYSTVKEDLFRRIFPLYKKNHIPISLDSRFRLLSFRGITVATPNEPEVEEALNLRLDDDSSAVKSAGKTLLRKSEASSILITRGSQGMVLFEKGKSPFLIPIFGTKDIVDVTGAGDTVISVFTLALATGASYKEAARLANFAGGIVVMKKGTATVTPQELREAIESEN